ncbi:MAG: hypothetical protein VX346_06840 [Planctomycetota bacterium]|nr:hypothetical protein [Planctomycetota bacterium]
MKRLLGLLLVMGIVGCEQKGNVGNAVDPSVVADDQLVTDSSGGKDDRSNTEGATSAPADNADPVTALEKLEDFVEREDNGEIVRVSSIMPDITDAGLIQLKELNSLQSLELDDNQVTDAGVAELQRALPNCEIENSH